MRWLDAILTRWTWVWASSGSWWWTGKHGMLQSMGSQRVRHYWVTEVNWTMHSNFWEKSPLLSWNTCDFVWGLAVYPSSPSLGPGKEQHMANTWRIPECPKVLAVIQWMSFIRGMAKCNSLSPLKRKVPWLSGLMGSWNRLPLLVPGFSHHSANTIFKYWGTALNPQESR